MRPRVVNRQPDVAERLAIERQRVELESELTQLQMNAPFPTRDSILRRNRQIEELQAKLKALPAKPLPPLVGMEAGSYVVADTRLGKAWEPPAELDDSNHYHDWDPFTRR